MIIRPLTIMAQRVTPLRIQGHPIGLFYDEVTISNWAGQDADGIMLQSSQTNFGWWWET